MRFVEVVTHRRAGLETAGKHIFTIGWRSAAVKSLFGSVIEARDTTRRIKKSQGDIQTRDVVVRVTRAEKARLIVVIEKGNQPILRRCIVIRGNCVVMILDRLAVGVCLCENSVDQEVERIIHHRILLVGAAVLDPGENAAVGVRAVLNFTEHEKVRFP